MKILAINGSPRAKKGCTELMLQPLLEGMRQAGEQLIRDGKIAEDITAELNKLWFTPEEYRRLANEYFKEQLQSLE